MKRAAMPPSVWLDRKDAPRFEILSERVTADVCVIGGGISGVALTWFLRERGVSVALVERDAIASAASGRNAGFLLAGLASSYSELIERWGRTRARAALSLSAENREWTARLVHEERIACDHARHGAWVLAGDATEAQAMRASAAPQAEDGLPGTWHEAAALPAPYAAREAFHGGLFVEGDGELDPVRFVWGLAERARARRARIFEGARVEAIVAEPGGVRISCARGEYISAASAVVATNAWMPELLPETASWTAPKRAQMLATAPWPARVFEHPAYARHGYDYWRQTPDGRVLLGGCRDRDLEGEVGYDARPTGTIQAHLDAFLSAMGLAAAPVTHRWAGIMDFTPDGLPLVGAMPGRERVFVLGGYTGHGMGWAISCARGLTERLCAPGSPAFAGGLCEPARLATAVTAP
ncbi:MAG TPA: FAD-binding oxidoreductase [Candidatus Eisenbacteria bacterium]|nr:FAD-binding oxidoreductase [Candidatus Eisenbacteria bacterium]